MSLVVYNESQLKRMNQNIFWNNAFLYNDERWITEGGHRLLKCLIIQAKPLKIFFSRSYLILDMFDSLGFLTEAHINCMVWVTKLQWKQTRKNMNNSDPVKYKHLLYKMLRRKVFLICFDRFSIVLTLTLNSFVNTIWQVKTFCSCHCVFLDCFKA